MRRKDFEAENLNQPNDLMEIISMSAVNGKCNLLSLVINLVSRTKNFVYNVLYTALGNQGVVFLYYELLPSSSPQDLF